MLQKGDKVPTNIEVLDATGEVFKLEDLLGKRYLLYFYPKDATPGCTLQACSLRDSLDDFSKLGIEVYGISKDGVKSHQKFADKFSLNFNLLSDPDKKLLEAFGVLVEKSMFGKKYLGTSRSSFLIGTDGTVEHVWEDAKTKGHAEEVLEVIQSS